jgi:hypothetical protein
VRRTGEEEKGVLHRRRRRHTAKHAHMPRQQSAAERRNSAVLSFTPRADVGSACGGVLHAAADAARHVADLAAQLEGRRSASAARDARLGVINAGNAQ